MGKARSASSTGNAIGYGARLRQLADARHSNMDAAACRHVVLDPVFPEYISDAFQEDHPRLIPERKAGDYPEDPDEYRAPNIFWVPPEARRAHLKAQASQPASDRLLDDPMDLKTNLVFASPPLRVSDSGGDRLSSDSRGRGVPPTGEGLRQEEAGVGGLIT